MSDANVDLADAYVTVAARRTEAPVAPFDADFRRLGVERLDVKGRAPRSLRAATGRLARVIQRTCTAR
ncbi:MAG: hypothetical protein KGQ88_11430 [Chloroflexi bacterium]|nr:hypothetical protein [Chloroflexota bacterium]